VTVEEVRLDDEDPMLCRRFTLSVSDEILSTQRRAVDSLSPTKKYSLFYYYFASQKRKYFPQHSVFQNSRSMYQFYLGKGKGIPVYA